MENADSQHPAYIVSGIKRQPRPRISGNKQLLDSVTDSLALYLSTGLNSTDRFCRHADIFRNILLALFCAFSKLA